MGSITAQCCNADNNSMIREQLAVTYSNTNILRISSLTHVPNFEVQFLASSECIWAHLIKFWMKLVIESAFQLPRRKVFQGNPIVNLPTSFCLITQVLKWISIFRNAPCRSIIRKQIHFFQIVISPTPNLCQLICSGWCLCTDKKTCPKG